MRIFYSSKCDQIHLLGKTIKVVFATSQFRNEKMQNTADNSIEKLAARMAWVLPPIWSSMHFSKD